MAGYTKKLALKSLSAVKLFLFRYTLALNKFWKVASYHPCYPLDISVRNFSEQQFWNEEFHKFQGLQFLCNVYLRKGVNHLLSRRLDKAKKLLDFDWRKRCKIFGQIFAKIIVFVFTRRSDKCIYKFRLDLLDMKKTSFLIQT